MKELSKFWRRIILKLITHSWGSSPQRPLTRPWCWVHVLISFSQKGKAKIFQFLFLKRFSCLCSCGNHNCACHMCYQAPIYLKVSGSYLLIAFFWEIYTYLWIVRHPVLLTTLYVHMYPCFVVGTYYSVRLTPWKFFGCSNISPRNCNEIFKELLHLYQ